MSLLCIKLRSFLGVILHSDCLSPPSPSSPPLPPPPSPPPLLPSPPDVTCGRRQQEQEQECPIASLNGSKPSRCDSGQFPVYPPRVAGDPSVHLNQQQRSTRARSSTDGATAILVPSSIATATSKPVQNIYRKPMSRINSNPSLRRSRDQHIRCNQRLSRHVQLWESDPGDVIYYYSPNGSTQLPAAGPTQGQVEEDVQGAQGYRRRVYTMPSAASPPGPDAPRGSSCRRKVPRSLEIKRETALGRGTQSPKEKQQLIHNRDVF